MGSRRNRARRRSVGAAVTFAVAAAAGVAGNKLTGKVTVAWVVFAGLVVIGILLTYWLDRHADKNNRVDVEDDSTNDRSIDARGAQGVQIGDHNIQDNYFTQGPHDGPEAQ